jgi:pilus assembly protein Flp/PilA
MRRAWQKTRSFLASEGGPSAVEYALMLALIAALCLPTVFMLGYRANNVFVQVIWPLRTAGGS